MEHPFAQLSWIVLVNTEGQHGVWPAMRPVPAGWKEVGPEGPRDTCLDWIAGRWKDMRPVSLRG